MKKIDNIIGIAGFVMTVAALIWYSITRLWEVYHWILLVLGVAGIAYFLFTYYTKREKRLSTQSIKYGSNILVQIIVVLLIVSLLAFLTNKRTYRNDLTKNQLYSLADQTRQILADLPGNVQIKAFFKPADERVAKDILDEYSYRSSSLSYEIIDPDKEPNLARQYGITAYNTVVVESGLKREMITELNETNVTNAIIKVTREQDKVIYFLTGHGERRISDQSPQGLSMAVEAIKNENHLVKELNLAQRGSIPDSCTVLTIVSPINNLFPSELDTIKQFVDGGGKLLVMVDPDRTANLDAFMAQYAITIGKDMVIERSPLSQILGAGPGIPLVNEYDENHPVTQDFQVMTFFPYTSSLLVNEDRGGYRITELARTSSSTFAEKDYTSGTARYDEGIDLKGPITIAAIIEKDLNSGKSAIALFGDSDFASNAYFNQQGNANLFLNTINFLAEEEDLISIRPKQIDDRRLTMTQANVTTVFYLVVIAIPLLVVITGVAVFFRRNRA